MRRTTAVLPLLLLVAYGLLFALAGFGGGLPAFDDHPGQFFRLWHALERSIPSGAWTADWNPDWWGGYPELQFYPPGFALLGAAIRLLTAWNAPVSLVYQLLCGVVLLLPALATHRLVARATGDPWLALPPAFVALTLSSGLRGGVEESLRWGMLTSRLALGCLPLLALSLRPWLEHGRRPGWAPAALAAALLAHPAAGPAALTMVAVASGCAIVRQPAREALRVAVALTALGLAWTAFWSVPLLLRREFLVPLAWGDLTLRALADEVARRPVVLAVLATAPLAWVAVIVRRRLFDAFLALLPLGLTSVLLLDRLLFARGLTPFEPTRILDGVVLAALWAAGVGGAAVIGRLLPARASPAARPVIAGALVLTAALTSGAGAGGPTGEPTLTLWPARAGWPSLDELPGDLPRLWALLRERPDRALFLTSSLRLDGSRLWYAPHSHVTSLAPVLAAREIVHGTFTHPSPLAARFYAGRTTAPAVIRALVETFDGQKVMGQSWEDLDAAVFEDFARRLRVATVVVPTAEARRARFLESAYAPRGAAAGFTLFERRDRPWPLVERITHRRFRLLASPAGGLWVPTGIFAYPLWSAKSARGDLPMRTDPWGLIEVRLPLDVFEAELVYREGAVEWAGVVVTLAAVVLWAVWWRRGRRLAPPRRPAPGTLQRRRRGRPGP